MSRPRSAAVPLAIVWIALVVWASLYPFGPWNAAAGRDLQALVVLPWPRRSYPFDVASNVIGYLPLGALIVVGMLRAGRPAWLALAAGAVVPSALSYAMEVAQHFTPHRVPSALDFVLNAAGALGGALVALAAARLGALAAWERWRSRWFASRSPWVLALLVLWPVGLLFPQPVPFGLGQLFEWLRAQLVDVLADTPWDSLVDGWPSPELMAPLSPAAEMMTIVCGLLAPCLVAFTIARSGWRRLPLVAGAGVLGFATTTLSTALNFGPQHALAWLTPAVLPGAAAAGLLALALLWLPRRAAAGLGLVVVTALVAFVAQAPADPYYAESLQAWEQGRFIRFHGLARWVGWLWPYAAMLLLLARTGGREEPAEPRNLQSGQ